MSDSYGETGSGARPKGEELVLPFAAAQSSGDHN